MGHFDKVQQMTKRIGWILGVWVALFFGQLAAESPSALYLSWLRDPTTTMVVQWHSDIKSKSSEVLYRKMGETKWQKQVGSAVSLKRYSRLVHTVELTGLEPDTMYQFCLCNGKVPYRFRTCPKAGGRALRFAVGGDVYFYLYLLRQMNKEIAKKDPDFVIVGGDIAYTQGHKSFFKGKDWEIKRWTTFFREWKKQMVAPDGRLIPMVPVVGNHDVKNAVKYPKAGRPIFYDLFAMRENTYSYRALDFGSYFSLFLLDTGHTHPIEGEQSSWLNEALSSRKEVPYKMAAYHVAAYPSVYSYTSKVPTLMRETWVPLFEQYGMKAAFENHNHAYKRTYPLKEGRVDPTGVLYLGDGAWGVPPRKPVTATKEWYLAKTLRQNCFWLVELQKEKCAIKSYDIRGKLIEEIK